MTSTPSLPQPAVRTSGLGKQFRSRWALEDCSIEIPDGAVAALIGPNGAGKTTLLRLLAGLRSPTTGGAQVFGRTPGDDPGFLATVGYLAQTAPLYRQLSVADHLRLGAKLNEKWDNQLATARLDRLRIPLDQRAGTLSGGQRAQVALALALAKQPSLLLLDEPVAALDPLARREFLATLAAAVADGGLTVLMSSHLIQDLERVCDHLVLLADSRTQLCEPLDDVIAGHRLLVGTKDSHLGSAATAVHTLRTQRQIRVVARIDGPVLDPSWDVCDATLEDIVLAYMGQSKELDEPRASLTGGRR
jgi:ABC-2 type transport system ATP-binding protein